MKAESKDIRWRIIRIKNTPAAYTAASTHDRQLYEPRSRVIQTRFAERAHWLTVEWLPKYAPELNDIEVVWGDLKARHLAHQTFIRIRSTIRGPGLEMPLSKFIIRNLAVRSPPL